MRPARRPASLNPDPREPPGACRRHDMVVKFVKALSALVALLALLVGVPVLLVTLAGNPIPPGGLDEIALMTDHTILGLLAVIGWVFWAQIATCVFAEIPAALSGRAATRVPVATGAQPV